MLYPKTKWKELTTRQLINVFTFPPAGENDTEILQRNKDAARLHEMLWVWREQAAKLEAGEISKADYDKWRYHYPEFDATQKITNVISQELSDMLVD